MGDPIFRGFAASGMGPRVKSTDEGIGGQNFYKITTELSFPLGLPKEMNVIGNLFADYGAIWQFDLPKNSTMKKADGSMPPATKADFYDSKKPNFSVGFGILWITNIAPIRVDWAIPISKKKYDETQRWHFRFTASF
jgi:outer membrane protein insertion porin family